jgi:proteasome lid subunit RPN8/RPN11
LSVILGIDGKLIEEIGRHGARAYPNECCGALLGVATEDAKQVRELLPLDNRREGKAARTRFLVTAEDYRWVEKQARGKGLDILGFYHSHPDHPARPSEFDREQALPWYSYIVVSVSGGVPQDTTNWILADDPTTAAGFYRKKCARRLQPNRLLRNQKDEAKGS